MNAKEIKKLLKDIFSGDVDKENLPENLYFEIAEFLKGSLYKGFGGSLEDFEFGGTDYELLNELRTNIYMFSAAKTYQQVWEMSDMVADSEGFKDFYDKAKETYDLYNETWAEAEYNTCIGQAQQARQWNTIEAEKDALPLLRYSAVMDANTSEICAPLDGIILPVDDPFWDTYSPLNHFNCRCVLEQLEEGQVTSKGDVKEATEEIDKDMDDVFRMNPGKDGYIFNEDHPYFEVARGDRGYAERNFDLPIPEND